MQGLALYLSAPVAPCPASTTSPPSAVHSAVKTEHGALRISEDVSRRDTTISAPNLSAPHPFPQQAPVEKHTTAHVQLSRDIHRLAALPLGARGQLTYALCAHDLRPPSTAPSPRPARPSRPFGVRVRWAVAAPVHARAVGAGSA